MKVKRFLKKIVSWAGLFFFGVATYAIYHQLAKYDLEDIKEALLAIPVKNLLYACTASFLGYIALSSYDFLAIKYIGKKLSAWKWIFAGFIGFSISNNAQNPWYYSVCEQSFNYVHESMHTDKY